LLDCPETKTLLFHAYNSANNELRDRLGREPTAAELSDHLAWSPKKLEAFQRQAGRREYIESEEHPDQVDQDDDLVHFIYHDLSPLQQKIFEYRTGYMGSSIMSGKDIMDKLENYTGATIIPNQSHRDGYKTSQRSTIMSEETLEPQSNSEIRTTESELAKVAKHQDKRLLDALNTSAPSYKKNGLPTLPEKSVVGYNSNVKITVQAVVLDGFIVEKYTGYDFLLMRASAAKQGISLVIASAFRSMEEQTHIYNERYNPDGTKTAIGIKKGPAAKPGFSNHQEGISIDIRVDLTVAELKAGRTTPVYLWLKANAGLFGFINDVPSEPWHWTHKEKKIIGTSPDVESQQILVNAGVAGLGAIDDGRTNLSVYIGRDLYDNTRSWARSSEMTQTTRARLFASQGEHAVHQSAKLLNYISQVQQTRTLRQSIEPKGVVAGNTLEYNF
jgi:LAS superfamily LD-carboxypeptidase LdcB